MRRTNRELVLENLEGFNRFDHEFVADGYAADGVPEFAMRRPLRGLDETLTFFRKQFVPITNTRIEITNVVEADDPVIVERVDHYHCDGVPVFCRLANFTGPRDGKITLWRESFDRQHAAEQVRTGLAKQPGPNLPK